MDGSKSARKAATSNIGTPRSREGDRRGDGRGVGIVADTREEARESVRIAIEMQIAGLREDGLPVPEPSGEYVEVNAA